MAQRSPIPGDRAAPPAEGAARCTVTVLGTRLDRYVEFEFSLNDPDLTVELVMPRGAFDEFCAVNGARVVTRTGDAPEGRPGLYRAPEARPDEPA